MERLQGETQIQQNLLRTARILNTNFQIFKWLSFYNLCILPLQCLNHKQNLNYTQCGNHCGRGGGRQSGQLILPVYKPDCVLKPPLSEIYLQKWWKANKVV